MIAFVVVAALVAAAFALNPSPDAHRAKIKSTIAERSPIAGVLGLGAVAAFFSNYHSLGVASYTTVNGRTVSVGAFGVVAVLEPKPAQP